MMRNVPDNAQHDTKAERGRGREVEMVALDSYLNNVKGKLMNGAVKSFLSDKSRMVLLTRFAMLYKYMSDDTVVQIWKSTSIRMQQTLAVLDAEIAASTATDVSLQP